MMRRWRGPRNWQLRRQLGKDQFPDNHDNLGAGVESASRENPFTSRYLRRLRPAGAMEENDTALHDLVFGGPGVRPRRGGDTGWLY
jgi:hypothetical protein